MALWAQPPEETEQDKEPCYLEELNNGVVLTAYSKRHMNLWHCAELWAKASTKMAHVLFIFVVCRRRKKQNTHLTNLKRGKPAEGAAGGSSKEDKLIQSVDFKCILVFFHLYARISSTASHAS